MTLPLSAAVNTKGVSSNASAAFALFGFVFFSSSVVFFEAAGFLASDMS
jgi:hypothetical protein